ncbi:MAG: DUF420 domain-containing protein [Halanaeroarchaeum sp.]
MTIASLPLSMPTRREIALTVVPSFAAIALVLSAVLGVVARSALPRAPAWIVAAIPLVNATASLLAIGTILAGWRRIRAGDVTGHRRLMGVSLVLFGTFLVGYLYRVALVGPTHFTGTAALRRFVFLPVLAVHVTLAVVAIPLLVFVVVLALERPTAELRASLHPTVGRVAATLWLASFALGLVVYGLLYLV